jgi:hypothetical protein
MESSHKYSHDLFVGSIEFKKMNQRNPFPGVLLLCLAILWSLPALAQAGAGCDTAKVQYSPVEDKYMDNIKVQAVTELQAPDNAEKQFSPQKTIWLYADQPDYQKNGPWTTTVIIRSSDGHTLRKLTFLDHGSGGVKLEWLNERLLFGRVWWGRILSTDFVLDVQNREFIYQQNAYYGDLMEACE